MLPSRSVNRKVTVPAGSVRAPSPPVNTSPIAPLPGPPRRKVCSRDRPIDLPEDPAAATVQLWSRLRDDLMADMTRLRNRLHALLLRCDPQYPQRVPRLTTQKGLAACLAYVAPGDGPLARVRERAVRQVARLLGVTPNTVSLLQVFGPRGMARVMLSKLRAPRPSPAPPEAAAAA